jgi:hypothetical protein
VTPHSETPDSEAADNNPRLSRRAIALGSVGVLAAGAAVAAAGFLGGSSAVPREAPQAGGTDSGGGQTQQGQLGTLPLHDEKPMRAIGKGVASEVSPSGTPPAASPPTPHATSSASPTATP